MKLGELKSNAKSFLNKEVVDPTGITGKSPRKHKIWIYIMYGCLAAFCIFLFLLGTGFIDIWPDARTVPNPMNNIRRSVSRPPPVNTAAATASHREYMFKRPKMNDKKVQKKMAGDEFGGYYGMNPRGFSQGQHRMKAKLGQTHEIDEGMAAEEEDNTVRKTTNKMKNMTKSIKPGTYNTGHIEQVSEINAATNISARNDFSSPFGRNNGSRTQPRYIQPLEPRGVTADRLNFASITK